MSRDKLPLALFLELLALAVAIWTACFLVRFSQPFIQPSSPEQLRFANRAVYDRPLLTVEQSREAVRTGRVAFWCAGKHYVVENIPTEYTFKE